MNEPYNRIVLIGNGFDKAIGMKTDYSDFIIDHIKDVTRKLINTKKLIKNFNETSSLISITIPHFPERQIPYMNKLCDEITSFDDLMTFIRDELRGEINYEFPFMAVLIKSVNDKRWVDIEQSYYSSLKEVFLNNDDKMLYLLNECMDELSTHLNKYIKKEQDSINSISHMESLIDKLHTKTTEIVKGHDRGLDPKGIIFLNFNYTNTLIRLFMDVGLNNFNHIYIHGSVDSKLNPIIFGYGDDTDSEYSKLEDTGEGEFLRKIKSFHYPRTNNYHKLLYYLGDLEYEVFIVGHSCGLSDKTLLKTIFEHENCLAIKNFHYKGEEEDFNKRIEISRHFNDKTLMRERLLPFDENATIPQL